MNKAYPEWVPPLALDHFVANVAELVRVGDHMTIVNRAMVYKRVGSVDSAIVPR